MELYLAIRKTIEIEGMSILCDKRLVNFLSDFHAFSSNDANKNVFRMLYASNYLNEIYSICHSYNHERESEIRREIQRLSSSFSEHYGIKFNQATYCIESIFYAINLIPSITVDFDSPMPYESNIIGLWDFHYKENKEMKLEIRRDGTAKAASGTIYKWENVNEQFCLFIEDFVYYNGNIKDGEISGTAVSIYKPAGWHWYATRRDDGLTKSNLISGEWIIINDVADLEDNKVTFLENGILQSDLYDLGKWQLEDEVLEMFTANNFIRYTVSLSKGKISGVGRNKIGNEWNVELIKK
jgi:hypothetical protein